MNFRGKATSSTWWLKPRQDLPQLAGERQPKADTCLKRISEAEARYAPEAMRPSVTG